MSSRPSFRWPMPYEVSRWFSTEELCYSKVAGNPVNRPKLDQDPVPVTNDELVELAERFDLGGTKFFLDRELADINAYVRSLAGEESVVVGGRLLEAPAPIRDWFVAHELAHIASRHSRSRKLATYSCLLVFLLLSVSVSFSNLSLWRLGAWFGFVLIYGFVSMAFLAFKNRAMEREADWVASKKVVRPDMRDFKAIFVQSSCDLDPPWSYRVRSLHPPPAERLEFLSRL